MKFASDTYYSYVTDITPALAQEMLDTSIGNRPLSQHNLKVLVGAMKRGEWRVTSQGIGFDKEGHLRDGHHRLTACIKSGVTIPSLFVLGMGDDAYDVTDTGLARSYADRLHLPREEAEILRTGCEYVLNISKPTVDQMRPYIDSGFGDVVKTLSDYCGTKKKYYSKASIRLAACITIMDGGDEDYVLRQYKALCTEDFNSMSSMSQTLVKQVNTGKLGHDENSLTLARALKVFDKARQAQTKLMMYDGEPEAALARVRNVLNKALSIYQKFGGGAK